MPVTKLLDFWKTIPASYEERSITSHEEFFTNRMHHDLEHSKS